ncbi:hypothetical protein [Penaeicola halotolerans]|uniref:hypothetical protein n=1 Tax=Penaeicola halotolerans TaxID=2793196 RepID=UPI001CF91A2B|nr:hypothetical protein [Penaeicola halotolerans]
MKKLLLLLCFLLFGLANLQAQKLDMTIGFGSYRVPNQVKYELPREGFNTNFGLMYQYNEYWAFGTGVNHSAFNYYRVSLMSTPMAIGDFDITGRVNSGHLYFLGQRKFNLPLKINGAIGIGLGGYIEANEYYVAVNFDEERALYTGMTWNRDIETGLHFPVIYNLKKVIANKIHVGIEGGLFFDRSLNIRGIFFGPKAGVYL